MKGGLVFNITMHNNHCKANSHQNCLKTCIALHGISELRSVTCHMVSHSATCHPTQVSAPRLNPSHAGRYSIYLPRMDGRLSWPCYSETQTPGVELATSRSRIQRPNHWATEQPLLSVWNGGGGLGLNLNTHLFSCFLTLPHTVRWCTGVSYLQQHIHDLRHNFEGTPTAKKKSTPQFKSCNKWIN